MTDAALVRSFLTGFQPGQRHCYKACRATFNSLKEGQQVSDDDLEDIFHIAFETLWDYIDNGIIFAEGSGVKMRTSDGGIYPLDDLTGAYFAGLFRDKLIEFCEAHRRIIPAGDPPSEQLPAADTPGEPDIDAEKERLTLIAINSLPRSCVEILTKFYGESKTLREILEERPENISYDGLKTRKSKCLTALKTKIITLFKAHGFTCP